MIKNSILRFSIATFLILFVAITLSSCTKKGGKMLARTKMALESSRDRAVIIAKHKEAINATIELFREAFLRYEKKELTNSIPKLYAGDAFLNDRIKIVTGLDNIKKYFAGTFQLIDEASFDVKDVAMSERDAYIRWTMKLKGKGKKDFQEYLGVSQLRFNNEGKIIFHFDHWDFSEILEHAPVLGGIIRYARSKAAH